MSESHFFRALLKLPGSLWELGNINYIEKSSFLRRNENPSVKRHVEVEQVKMELEVAIDFVVTGPLIRLRVTTYT